MEEKDKIAELFKDGLQDYSSPVKEHIWNNISSKLNHAPIASTASKSLLFKIAVGLTTVAIATFAVLYFIPSEKSAKSDKNEEHNSKTKDPDNTNQVIEEKQTQITFEQEVFTESPKNEVNTSANPSTMQIDSMQEAPVVLDIIDNDEDILVVKEQNSEIIDEIVEENEFVLDQQISQENQFQEDNDSPIKTSSFQVKLPNIFTPNNDGANDLFELNLQGLKEISFVVMDNDGNVVYQSDQIYLKWDGKSANGDPLKEGAYIYLVSGIDESGLLYKAYSNLDIRF